MIMNIEKFARVSFHHLISLIQRDDGNKTYKTLEKETGFPRV